MVKYTCQPRHQLYLRIQRLSFPCIQAFLLITWRRAQMHLAQIYLGCSSIDSCHLVDQIMIASRTNMLQFDFFFERFFAFFHIHSKFPWMVVRDCRLANALMEVGEIDSALEAVKTGLNKDSSELVSRFRSLFSPQAIETAPLPFALFFINSTCFLSVVNSCLFALLFIRGRGGFRVNNRGVPSILIGVFPISAHATRCMK